MNNCFSHCKIKLFALVCCVIWFNGFRAWSQVIPMLKARPEINGELNDDFWQGLPWHSDFHVPGEDSAPEVGTRFKIGHNQHELFLAIECDEPAMANLRDKPDYSAGSSMIWLHDSIEVNILPEENLQNLYKFIVTSKGVSCAMWGEDDNTDRGVYVFQRPYINHLRVATKRLEDKWLVELALPLGAINYSPGCDNKWRFNIGRTRYAGGKPELSASSKLSNPKSHIQTRDFNQVELEALSLKPYQWEIDKLATNLLRDENGKIKCHFAVDFVNRSTEFRICHASATLRKVEDGLVAVGKVWKFDVPGDEFSRQQGGFILPSQGEFHFELSLRDSREQLLKSFCSSVTLQYQPLKARMLKPPYRNNIYSSMPDKGVELEILLEENVGCPLLVTVKGKKHEENRRIAKSKETNLVIFDAENWPEGKYQISVKAEAADKPMSSELTLQKLPFQKGEIWLDADGIVHYEGKPRLPIGWYSTTPPNSLYDSAVMLTHFKDFDSFAGQVARNEKNEAINIYVPYQEFHPQRYNNWKWAVFRDPEDRKGALTVEQKKLLADFLKPAGKLSGYMGWYMADEPEARDHNPTWYIEVHKMMQELDPYHPAFMLNWGIEGMRKFAVGCDILMPDCYPQFFEDGSTGKPRWSTSQWMQTIKELGKPGWLMVQISPWPNYSNDGKLKGVPPSYDDIRSQFYQALLHDAKGITMYAYYDSSRFEGPRLGTDSVTREIRVLEDLLIRNSLPDAVRYKAEPEDRFFQVGMKKHEGVIGIIAVNTSRNPMRLHFQSTEPLGEHLFVAGEKRRLKVANGAFSDSFAPCETHVYLNDQTLADKVIPIADCRDEIARAIAARKRPGNIIGTGELYAADYENFGKEIFPADMARLSASSEVRSYSTRNTGTLYYLLDGLTDPPQAFYAWRPQKNDKNPWLEIRLSEEAAAQELRLYSGYTPDDGRALLQAASVSLVKEDGSLESLAHGAEVLDKCLRLTFPKTRVKQLRIQIESWRESANGHLLTEIELY